MISEKHLHPIVLGVVQGVTEFLPISSSGHLILIGQLLSSTDQGLLFDMTVNSATFLAILALYYKKILKKSLMAKIILTSIPTGIVGFLFQKEIASLTRNTDVVILTTFFFGIMLGISEYFSSKRKTVKLFSIKDALIISLFQPLALIPGTSRSGITITAALALGYKRKDAAEISFMISLPVSIMVAIKNIHDLFKGVEVILPTNSYLLGFIAAFITATITVKLLLKWLTTRTFLPFVIYRIALATVMLLLT